MVDDPDDELEPQLKYERLGGDVKAILQRSEATCLCLSEKILALGTAEGSIHVLDYAGNEVCAIAARVGIRLAWRAGPARVDLTGAPPTHPSRRNRPPHASPRPQVKRLTPHSAPIRHLSFDEEAEYIGSCADSDNVMAVRRRSSPMAAAPRAVLTPGPPSAAAPPAAQACMHVPPPLLEPQVSNLYTDESGKFTFKRPVLVVALDPRYSSRKTREFVTGDVRGRVKLSSQASGRWFRRRRGRGCRRAGERRLGCTTTPSRRGERAAGSLPCPPAAGRQLMLRPPPRRLLRRAGLAGAQRLRAPFWRGQHPRHAVATHHPGLGQRPGRQGEQSTRQTPAPWAGQGGGPPCGTGPCPCRSPVAAHRHSGCPPWRPTPAGV